MSGHFDLRLTGEDLVEDAAKAFARISEALARLNRASTQQAKEQALESQEEARGNLMEEQRYDFREDIIKVLQAEQLIDLVRAASDKVGCDACTIRCRELLEQMEGLREHIQKYNFNSE